MEVNINIAIDFVDERRSKLPPPKFIIFILITIVIAIFIFMKLARAEIQPKEDLYKPAKTSYTNPDVQSGHITSLGSGIKTNRNLPLVKEPDWDKLVPIIIQIESSGNPNAISKDGCIGLMQISPLVYKEFREWRIKYWHNKAKKQEIKNFIGVMDYPDYPMSIKDNPLFIPQFNIQIGTWYLKRIWFHYLPYYKIPQTIDNLLIAYNWGIGNLRKWYFNKNSKFILPMETHEYLIKYNKLAKQKNNL